MPISAGKLNTRVTISEKSGGVDSWGQPVLSWEPLGNFSAAIKNETGMGAIRSAAQGGIPASVARYSFLVRAEVIRHYGVNPAHRLEAKLPFSDEVTIFSVTGVVSDFDSKDRAYILTEVGGNAG